MRRKKRDYHPTENFSGYNLTLIPVPELKIEFQKRFEEIQEIVRAMIQTGRKKGRPRKQEEIYEEAA